MSKLRVTYVKSSIGYNKRQKSTIKALGLRKLNQTVEQIIALNFSTHYITGLLKQNSALQAYFEVKGIKHFGPFSDLVLI